VYSIQDSVTGRSLSSSPRLSEQNKIYNYLQPVLQLFVFIWSCDLGHVPLILSYLPSICQTCRTWVY